MPTDPVIRLEKTRQCLHADDVNLSDSTFENVKLTQAVFHNVNLSDTTIDDANLSRLKISRANLNGATIVNSLTDGMTINGISVADLLAAYRAAHPTIEFPADSDCHN